MTIIPWPWLPFPFCESKAGKMNTQGSIGKHQNTGTTWDHREATKWQASNTVRPTRWMYRVTSATGSCINCTIQPNNYIEIQPFKSATHHSFLCFLKRLLSWFQYLLMLSPLTSTGSWKLITVLMFGLERKTHQTWKTLKRTNWQRQKHKNMKNKKNVTVHDSRSRTVREFLRSRTARLNEWAQLLASPALWMRCLWPEGSQPLKSKKHMQSEQIKGCKGCGSQMKPTSQGCYDFTCVCERTSHNTQKNKALLIPILHCCTVKWQESRVKPLHFGTAGEKLPALSGTDHSKYKCFGRGLGHI